jgi:hypothetical protein
MFINLGWIGVVLLGVLIATGYRNVIGACRRAPDIGSLRIAFFLAAVVTGFTEAAFRMMGLPWITFLLATAAAPVDAGRKGSSLGGLGRQLKEPGRGDSAAVLEGAPGRY